MNQPANKTIITDRLQCLIEDLYQQDPHAINQLSNAGTHQDFLESVCCLINRSRRLTSHLASGEPIGLSDAIARFMSQNLHRGPTLKTLAQSLGYSEKYCSALFRSTMGESFSRYLKRLRTEQAITLLTTTNTSVTDIASILGFSDPFTFSHFFKRTTGESPRAFRTMKMHVLHNPSHCCHSK